MARKRMIDPNFWVDEKLGTCDPLARFAFMGLISQADDDGRMNGHPSLIKSVLFPYDYGITAVEVDEWLKQLETKELIIRYQVNNQSYICLPKFSKHQTINKKTDSKLPAPPLDINRKDGHYGSATVAVIDNYDKTTSEEKRKEEKRKEEKRSEDERKGTVTASANNPFIFFELNGFGTLSPKITEDINYWLDGIFFDEPNEIILKAMGEAVDNNARTWKYVEAILKNWNNKNLKTIQSVEAHLKAYEANRSPKINIKPRSEPLPEYMVNQPKRQEFQSEEIDEAKQREVDELLRQLGEIP